MMNEAKRIMKGQPPADAPLAESENRFRAFVAASSDIIYRMSPDWSEMRQLEGRGFLADTIETLGDWRQRYILPEDRAKVQAAIDQAIRTRSMFELEHRVERADGSIGWALSRAMPILDEHGEITEWIGAASDITERKASEQSLRQSEARYRTLFEAIDSGFCIIEMIFGEDGRATDYRFVEANPAFERQSGLVDAVGRRIREFAPNLEEHWLERYGRVALTGESMRVEGEVAPLGRWFDINAFRVGAPEQRRVAVLFTDISGRREAEDGLRQSEEWQTFLLKLSDALRPLGDAADIQGETARLLREHFDAGWSYYIELDETQTVINVARDSAREGLPSMTGQHDFSDMPEFLARWQAGLIINVEDFQESPLLSDRAKDLYRTTGIQSFLGVPVLKDGVLIAALVLADIRPQSWSRLAIDLTRESAERTRAAVERARSEEALSESEERFRLINDSLTDYGIFTTDAAGIITGWSSGAERILGYLEEEAVGMDARAIFTPEDRARGAPDREIAQALAGHAVNERWHLRKDGSRFWGSGAVLPLRDGGSKASKLVKIMRDETARRQADQHQNLLLAELQHRVRNILAMTRSVARRTAQTTEDVDVYVDHLEGRISAMARVQTILTRDPGRGVDLRTLLLDELEVQTASQDQYRLDGPDVELGPKAAEVLSLAIHELATNSVKYGALSDERSTVTVRWSIERREGERRLRFEWHEPIVGEFHKPERRGFGTELIERRVPYELHGSGKLDLSPDGVRATIEFPLVVVRSILETGAVDGVSL